MAKYMFRLEHMHVAFQRGKRPDVYVSTFGIEVGSRAIGPIGRFLDKASPAQLDHGISSGANINFSDFPPDNPASRWGTWDIGPTEIGTGDIAAIDYAFVDTSDNGPSLSRGDQFKIGVTSYTAIVGVGLAASGVGAVVGAIVAGVGAVIGELVGDLIGSDPKCNGVAFADKIVLTGADIAAGTNNPNEQMTITRTSGNPDIPSECGHPSSGEITFSVTAVPVESVKRFLGSKGDLTQGIKKALNLTQLPISVRSLIEA
jgi:hypothetical protein